MPLYVCRRWEGTVTAKEGQRLAWVRPNRLRDYKMPPADEPLIAHLTQLGVQTLIICGESTSGCVRATAVDAYSHGFHVVLVEECCFDRSPISHKVNLFDLHHKYADVMHVDEVTAHLDTLAVRKAS